MKVYRSHIVNGYVADNGAYAKRVYSKVGTQFLGWMIVDSAGNKIGIAPVSKGADNAQKILSQTA